MYYVLTLSPRHTINSNKNLLSIDITRIHTQMRKRTGKTEERQRVKILEKRKKGRKEKKFKRNQ